MFDVETQLYYLQSRYYNPELGRFINADAFVSTGQGLQGYNMFAYCANNSVNMVDPSGACGYIYSIYFWSDCNKIDCPQSKNYIHNNVFRKTVQVAEAVITNIDAGVGLGLGLSGNINTLDLVDLDVGMRYDLISIGYRDGKFYHVQEYFEGIDGTVLVVFDYELYPTHQVRGNPFSSNFGEWKDDTANDIWTIHGGGLYIMGGARYHIGLDVISLLADLQGIF